MDKLSWDILECLQENARSTYSEIGRKIGLSAPAVAERIQRMEETGIIKGYKPVIDFDKVGLPLRAIIGFKINHPANMAPFLKLLPGIPEIYECTRITGKDCMIMKVAVVSSDELEKLIDKLVEFGETTTSVVLSVPVDGKAIRRRL